MKRVVITGIGGVSPIGNTLDEILFSIKNSYCGIDYIDYFDTENFNTKLAAQVKNLDFENYIDKKNLKRMDKVSAFALTAAIKAVEDSLIDFDNVDRDRVGVYVSTGIGGLKTIEIQHKKGLENNFEKISPFFIPMAISNLTPSHIANHYKLHGSCICPVTACAGSNTAIGEAFRNIKHGYSDIILTGGSEASITELGIGGFASMKALSKSKDKNRGSIPFDKERDGFVMGEGAGVLILEELEHALNRNGKIYAEIIGYGSTCDAEHITRPNSSGEFAAKAMKLAIDEGKIDYNKIDYINAHGTSTPLNDKFETLAIKKVFKDNYKDILVSSTKSMTGHMLGASGAIEAIITLISMENNILPPNINHLVYDEECDLNIIENKFIKKTTDYALSNSLGFGGHNVSILFKRWE